MARTTVAIPALERTGPRTTLRIDPLAGLEVQADGLSVSSLWVRWTGAPVVSVSIRVAETDDWELVYSGEGGRLASGESFVVLEDLVPGARYDILVEG
jgi:hypothetical protein